MLPGTGVGLPVNTEVAAPVVHPRTCIPVMDVLPASSPLCRPKCLCQLLQMPGLAARPRQKSTREKIHVHVQICVQVCQTRNVGGRRGTWKDACRSCMTSGALLSSVGLVTTSTLTSFSSSSSESSLLPHPSYNNTMKGVCSLERNMNEW